MNYFERYCKGEFEEVWRELQALGSAVRQEPHYTEARQVAAETMRRVRRNCEQIISRLQAMGYVFGTFPDGTSRYYTQGALLQPTDEMRSGIAELEQRIGMLPISLVAFWEEVGAIDLVGMHPSWPDGLDPLVVHEPEGAISDLDNWDSLLEDGDVDESEQFTAGLAPDDLHKDNTSGGDPYSVALPDASADFELLYERHGMLFVPYLRMAILSSGGFPGLEGRETQFNPFSELISGLEAF